jgi:subtilisin family serine protease
MKKNYFLLFIAAIFASISINAQTVYEHYIDGRIWFKVKNNIPIEQSLTKEGKVDYMNIDYKAISYLKGIVSTNQITKLKRPFWMVKEDKNLSNLFELHFSNIHQVDQIIEQLKALNAIEYAEKVPLMKPCLTPNDPSYNSSTQWGLFKINAANAWNTTTGNPAIVVAIVDDAVQINHPDLQPNIWINTGEIANNGIDDDGNGYIDDVNGWDVADNDNNPNPPNSSYDHGTHVAGIAGARSNNNIGVASIGYSIKIMAVKSTNSASVVTDGYSGIVYAANSGAKVINMSWGGQGNSTSAQNIVNWAYNTKNCLLIAAAGNDNVNTQFYPAAYTNVVAVASTSNSDAKSSFSNYGTWIQVSAPGSSIYSTTVGSSYGYKSGTSMASPMAAGLAGLIWSVNPGMTKVDVRNCLLNTADNINAQNPSYNGQLGSGRINAQAAVNCAAATLSLPPVADFIANQTTIIAGQNVTFTNLSTYNPTSYSWTFAGGTPGTSTAANPPAITYNTPGTYNVTLVATNSNGSDTELKTAYITVLPNTGCDTLGDKPYAPIYTPTLYSINPASSGYVAGTNIYADKAKANYFNASPYNYITGCSVWFGKRYSNNPNKTVQIFVRNGTGGTPGAILTGASVTVTMGQIMADNDGFMFFNFPNPVTLPASKEIFVGVDISNLTWSTDTLAIVTNQAGQMTPGNAWEQQSNNQWYNYNSTSAWGIELSHYINAIVTDQPTVLQFTTSATTICQGNSVNFDATGSTAQDTLLWTFFGGTPFNSNNVQQTVFYNTPGTYKAYLQIIGGACSGYKIDSVTITVNPLPNISVTATPDTICPSGTSQLNATGNSVSYTWSPPTGLSSTTIANPIAAPANTITYSVTGTSAGGCQRTVPITVVVQNTPPLAEFIYSPTLICEGQTVNLNGAISDNATSYSWVINGATPATSNSPDPQVTFASAGTYNVTLTVQNNCSQNDDTTITITVQNCMSISENFGENSIHSFVNAAGQLNIIYNFVLAKRLDINIHNALGQTIYTKREIVANQQTGYIDITGFACGLYYLNISDGEHIYTYKFVR